MSEGLSRISLCALTITLLLGAGCSKPVVRIKEKPKGEGWTTYNQSYNFYTMSSSTSQSGNVQTTTTSYNSQQDFLEGTPLTSKETPLFQGMNNVRDCDFVSKKEGAR